ncbi:hypothetical protein PHMEG_00040388, partial [Phytophthora megakarya]
MDYVLEEKEDIPEDAILAAGRSSGVRPLARNLMEELDEVVGPEPAFGDDDDEERDDDDDDSKPAVTTSQVTEQKKNRYRPPMNGDTPAAKKVLGRTYEEMMEKIGFGVTDIHYPQPPVGKTAGGGVDPSKIPLPKTPSKGYNTVPKSHGMFSKSGDETPYFQDLHVITPKPSGRKERPDHESGRANATRSTVRGSQQRYDEDESSSDADEDLYRRPQQDGVLNEYIRQIEKASSPERERLTQKIELGTHRPLGQIRAFSGLRNKRENSMQWLR